MHGILQLYALTLGNIHETFGRYSRVGKLCGSQLFEILPNSKISNDIKFHVLRCFSRLDDPSMSHYILKRGFSPHGLILTTLRNYISLSTSGGLNENNNTMLENDKQSSSSSSNEQIDNLLIGLLANIYSYTFHDREHNMSMGIVPLLSYLLSHHHQKVSKL